MNLLPRWLGRILVDFLIVSRWRPAKPVRKMTNVARLQSLQRWKRMQLLTNLSCAKIQALAAMNHVRGSLAMRRRKFFLRIRDKRQKSCLTKRHYYLRNGQCISTRGCTSYIGYKLTECECYAETAEISFSTV